MATAKKTTAKKNAPKAGTKGAAARKTKTTPLGNTRAIDDNSFVPPKRKPKAEAETISFQQALAEAGQTVEDLVPPKDESPLKPAREAGTSNLATTIRNHRKSYAVVTSPTGKKTQNNGDLTAAQLLNIPLAAIAEYCQTKWPGLTYANLNPGHQRMCYGNRIRGLVKAGDQDTLLWLEASQPSDENSEVRIIKTADEAAE
jgi:hypothetical protein